MKRTVLIVVACVLLLPVASSAGEPGTASTKNGVTDLSINTRVAILEDRVATLQGEFDTLRTLPSQLARIGEQINNVNDKITALNEKSNGNSDIIQRVAMLLLSAGMGVAGTLLVTSTRGKH